MKIIFKIIAFPITLVISILCFLLIVTFCWGLVKEAKIKEATFGTAFMRLHRESNNIFIWELWDDVIPFFQAVISGVIYWLIYCYLIK